MPGIALGAACIVLLLATAVPSARADSLTAGGPVTPAGVCDFAAAITPGGGRSALVYTRPARDCNDVGSLYARVGRGRKMRRAVALERRSTRKGARAVQIFGARLAAGPDGSVVAAWIVRGRARRYDEVRAAVARPGHGFGGPQTLARRRTHADRVPEIDLAGVVAGRGATIVVSWAAGTPPASVLRIAVRRGAGRFGRQQTLGPIYLLGLFGEAPATLAVSPSGIVVAGWRPGEDHSATAATLRARHRTFGSRRKVSGGDDALAVRAVGGPGGAGVSWQTRAAGGAAVLMRLARLRRDAGLTRPATLAVADTAGGLEVDGPHVAFTAAAPFAAWQRFRDISEAGDGAMDMTSVQAAIAGARPATTLSSPGAGVGRPVLVALSDRALAGWVEGELRVAASRSGRWSPPRTLPGIAGRFTIAAARRSAIVAWLAVTEDGRQRVRLAVYAR
ncbi:MAG: hypothetical protein ACR2NB_10235 [Solirubrobacteraceae bacterium]